ncbi:MAG: hypothetical protein HQM10_05405 [Candidatus Riflebacteria bacterium]|nr:hypothetical protein [Candidatus Riflebacteria bacterium]
MFKNIRLSFSVLQFPVVFFFFSLCLIFSPDICDAKSEEKGTASRLDKASAKKKREIGRDKKAKKKGDKSEKDDSKKSEKTDDEENLFLKEKEETQSYLPDLFRCPECGYEQDEAGTCPDHSEVELINVRSKGKNPLEPQEYDGNEDILVDVQLDDLQFKKKAPEAAPAN